MKLLTTNEAAERLGRTASTLHNWSRAPNPPIKPVREGSRVLWRESDIKRILNGEVVIAIPRGDPDERKAQILDAAIELSKERGYANVYREHIGERLGVTPTLVTRYFATMHHLREAVMQAALDREIPEIIAQGIIAHDPIAETAPRELRERAVRLLLK